MSYSSMLQNDKRDGRQQTERDLTLFCRDIVRILGLHECVDQEIPCHTGLSPAIGAEEDADPSFRNTHFVDADPFRRIVEDEMDVRGKPAQWQQYFHRLCI